MLPSEFPVSLDNIEKLPARIDGFGIHRITSLACFL